MKKQEKIFAVQNLAEKLKQAKALILADYSGLNVSQINELRREIKKAGGEFEVVKNTLLRLAAKGGKWEARPERSRGMGSGKLEGPTAALWLYSDDVAPLKTLDYFIKKTELPKIKFGFWEGELISLERIFQLASLPGMEELKAKLVGILKSPLFGLVNGLNWNLRKLVVVLKTASTKVSAVKGGEQQIKN
jgi:large subunit ribosomal protein L10